MAVEPQPTKIPIWNTGGSNRTEPAAGEKVTGWVVDDQPPSSYFNWLQYYAGAWLTWLSQRVLKGTNEVDLIVNALTPDSPGAGGNLSLKAADGATSGGSLTMSAGDTTSSGPGGGMTVTLGTGNTSGGSFVLTAGDGDTAGGGITLTAGDNTNSGSGGAVAISAGDSVDATGGDVVINSGDTSGTDRNAGSAVVNTGLSTGTAGAVFDVNVSESESGGSGSGTYTNARALYCRMSGNSGAMNIQLNRFLRLDNSSDSTRGSMRTIGKSSDPSAPSAGDIHYHTGLKQLAVNNGTRYHNLNPLVFNNSDFAYTGRTPASPSASTEYVLEQYTYAGSYTGSPLKYTIPAGVLRVGSIVRVTAWLLLDDITGGPNFPAASIYVGSYGSGSPPWSSPTGLKIWPSARVSSSSELYTVCKVISEMSVRSLGASGLVDWRSCAQFQAAASVVGHEIQYQYSTPTVNTTGALDVFMSATYGTSTGYRLYAEVFEVEIL